MTFLKLNHVKYLYEGTDAGIQNITFDAHGGDLVAVVGRNGAGKSTLINLLSGVEKPQEGTISCSDDLTYHDLGISPQKQSIDWYLNVFDNINLGVLLTGKDHAECKKATDKIAAVLDLQELYKRNPDSVSGGQQQRIQVARALVHDPEILFLDEPTVGLDYGYSTALFAYLKDKCEHEKKLIFVSSHDLSLLEDYCNKILFLEEGRQVFFGDIHEFLKAHQLVPEYVISYSGSLSEDLQQQLTGQNIIVNGQTLTVRDVDKDVLNALIGSLLNEVSITGIESKKIGLKDIIIDRRRV